MGNEQNPWKEIFEKGTLNTWLSNQLPFNVQHISCYATPPPKALKNIDLAWWNLRRNKFAGYCVTAIDRIISNIFFKNLPRATWEKPLGSAFGSIKVHAPDFWLWQCRKLMCVYEQVIRLEFDYLYIINTSSYVLIENLVDYCTGAKNVGLYAGPVVKSGNLNFVSGSSRLISRDVLEMVVKNREHFDLWRVEDVQFGKVLFSLGVKPTDLSSTEINSFEQIATMTDLELKKNFHIRVKSGTQKKRSDVSIMCGIHERLSNNSVS
jgi:hypothetical protein